MFLFKYFQENFLSPLGRVAGVLLQMETAATVSVTHAHRSPAINAHDARVDDAGVPGHAGGVVNDRQIRDIVEERGDASLSVRDLPPACSSGSTRNITIVNIRGSATSLYHVHQYYHSYGGRHAGLIAEVLNVRGCGSLISPMSPYHLTGFHSG